MPRGGHIAAKARAARAYADLSLDELATRLGWSKETWGRVERGVRSLNSDERRAAAKACGIAPQFFELDLSQLEDAGQADELAETLASIRMRLSALELAATVPSQEAPGSSAASRSRKRQ